MDVDTPAARPPLPNHLSFCPHLFWCCRQLEERCRDMDIYDLQPFYASATFREAGFRLAEGGGSVMLARA